ncbi:MAG: aminoglycoside phosphotransferase [Cereibacter sphaeroides]|uniref:Aminoglycoside phosphotransferase n=1 Tax=Cereibacter sphaeroides TaxID=1063 RepID=A0A2W5SEI2_CERSP|nr:MAG: aminoglycoside phosphotransferase [Cereibacter sphaeroides]
MTDRTIKATEFLGLAGWGHSQRTPLAGDASARRYERLRLHNRTAILMDAPPGQGDDVREFLNIDDHLLGLGLSAPRIFACDEQQGFLLLEDLGDDLFSRLTVNDPRLEMQLYEAAVDVLLRLQAAAPPQGLTDFAAGDWAEAATLAPDWYGFALSGEQADSRAFQTALKDALTAHADGPRVLILRDYHAENLLWLPERAGLARVGLLDFQLGQMGQPAYDLVSLCQDARRDVSHAVEEAMVRRFATGMNGTVDDFRTAYAVLGAQRALRILGIFTRLCLVAGKPGYVELIPRVWSQLLRNLAHPALHRLAEVCEAMLPEPTSERLERIRTQCGQHAP